MKKDLITKKGESKMKLKNSLMFLSSLMLFAVIGCSSDDDDDDGVALIDTPTEYSFESRFSSGGKQCFLFRPGGKKSSH